MQNRSSLVNSFAALVGIAMLPLSGAPSLLAAGPPPARADFSGTWKLNPALGDDPLAREDANRSGAATKESGGPPATPEAGGSGRRGGGGRRRAGSGDGPGATPSVDLPLVVMQDNSRVFVADDGARLRITYVSGRQRDLVTDGDERELEDGEGPAKVSARRKGDRILISSTWSGGHGVRETWELLSNPRRLAITMKVEGRSPLTIRHVYDAAPPQTPPAPPGSLDVRAVATPSATPSAAGAAAPAPPPVVRSTKAECSVRPPRGTSQQELVAMAKITAADASARAVASVAPKAVSSVISSDVAVDDGCLVYTYDLRLAGEKGGVEILIDAGDGKVLSSETFGN